MKVLSMLCDMRSLSDTAKIISTAIEISTEPIGLSRIRHINYTQN